MARRAVLPPSGGEEGRIRIILVSDEEIGRLNARFLKRERPTDVLAFPLEDGMDDIFGEVYISMDRAGEQASLYRVGLKEELARLVIHGILHLHGYSDRTKAGQRDMRNREEAFLDVCRAAGLLG
ncbi:rRNA maturation RNase YbeY [bacterium]|nr:rRNA maturation RNase YbeY [bacterium]